MIPNFIKVHSSFKLNGMHYNASALKVLASTYTKTGKPYESQLGVFLLDWLDTKDSILVNTSGSTGKPKQIQLQKQAMVNSAIATGTFFYLKPGNRALLCLPTNYIAGKMMLVRALVLGLEIDFVEPTINPQFNSEIDYDFCAMIPLQLSNTKERLKTIKKLIVGGASVSNALKNLVKDLPTRIFETYGMTETITHIAVKPINNFIDVTSSLSSRAETRDERSLFKTLDNVSISQDDRGCLVITAPKLSNEKIITNDIVRLHSDTEFEWLGRFDIVINSGGLKFFPEQIEAKLQNTISNRFFITSETDEALGNKVILLIEGHKFNLSDDSFQFLDKHEIPKQVYFIDSFVETTSGKIQRQKTLESLKR